MHKKTKDLKGNKIAAWTVLEFGGYIKGNAWWLCRCNCGTEKLVKGQYLTGGQSTKCKTCAIPKRAYLTDEIPWSYWRIVLSNAKKRGIEVNITSQEALQMLKKQQFKCALSGLEIYMARNASEYLEGKCTASLDRIDSERPYKPDNLQWVHKDVNMMKHIFKQDYFLELCRRITGATGGSRTLNPEGAAF